MTLPPVAQHALEAFVVLNAVILMVTYVTLLERKFAARMQSRIGPYYVGRPHGWLQPIADALKLMIKEDIVPAAADRGVYNLAPVVFLVPCMLIFATIPFAPALGVADLGIGVLFFLAVSSLEIVGLFMGGWGSNNKYALLSAMRAVNQIISYDLPFVFAALVPVVLPGSLPCAGVARSALVSGEGAARLPGRHVGPLVLRADPRGPDPRDLLEAAAARDARPSARDRARGRHAGRRWGLTAPGPHRGSCGRPRSSSAPSAERWRSRCGTCSDDR